jgi:hypothetical protein
MTAGCACPRCGTGLTPQPDQSCRQCDIDANPGAVTRAVLRTIDRALNGPPVGLGDLTRRDPGREAGS